MNRLNDLKNQLISTENILSINGKDGQLLLVINNPKILNSIDHQMCKQISAASQILEYQLIIVRGVGQKAFSCGGDIKSMYKFLTEKDNDSLKSYFSDQLQVDISFHYFNQMPSTVHIAIFNGIAIGGALPFNVNAKIRICTENTSISIPESKNGLIIPGIHFFANMKNNLGTYLAMTGDFVKGEDCVRYGLCEYFVKGEHLESLQTQLLQQQDINQCKQVIEKYSQPIKETTITNEQYIKQLFKQQKFEQFWTLLNEAALQSSDKQLQKFSQHCLKQIFLSSPLATRVNYQLIIYSRQLKQQSEEQYFKNVDQIIFKQVKACFNMTQLSSDSIEGLKRASTSNRSYVPQWQHASPLDVEEELIDKIINYLDEKVTYILSQQYPIREIMNKKQQFLLNNNNQSAK